MHDALPLAGKPPQPQPSPWRIFNVLGDTMHLNLSDPRLIVGIAVIVLLIVVGIALHVRRRRNTRAGLRRRFGAEYDRAVLEHGSERNAEAKLSDRETRVENLKIRNLGATERERFVTPHPAVAHRSANPSADAPAGRTSCSPHSP